MSSFPRDRTESQHHRLVFTRTVVDETGKRSRQSKTLYFRKAEWTRAKVLDIKRELDYKLRIGEYDPWQSDPVFGGHQELGLEQAVERYLKDRRRSVSEKTLANYRLSLSHFVRFVGPERPLRSVAMQHVRAFINRDLKYRSRLTYRAHLSAFFGWAQKNGHCDGIGLIQFASTRAERKEKRKQYLTRPELELLCRQVEAWDGRIRSQPLAAKHHASDNRRQLVTVFRLMFYTGMRPSDVLNLKKSWITTDRKYIRIGDDSYRPKSQASIETVPIHRELMADVEWMLGQSVPDRRPVFGHLRLEFVSKRFKLLVGECLPQKADGLSLYRLRDSAVMFYTDQVGLQLHVVKDLLRHSDVNVTEIYRHHKSPDELYDLINK